MKSYRLLLLLAIFALHSCASEVEPMEPDPVNISITGSSVNEGTDYLNVSVSLQLSAAAESQITATVSTTAGTAEAGLDFVPLISESVVFAAGETQKSIDVTVIGDVIVEEDESFEVSIVSVTGPANIQNGTTTIELINDDEAGEKAVEVDVEVDFTELTSFPVGSEIPYEVMNFGQPANVPNAEFTSTAAVGDTIYFAPKINENGDSILYYNVAYDSSFNQYLNSFAFVTIPDSVATEWFVIITNNDVNDVEVKYDLHFMVGTDQGRFGPYLIDPKMRVPK